MGLLNAIISTPWFFWRQMFILKKFVFNLFFFFLILKIFWPCCTACGILVPRPGKEPVPPAVEAPGLNHCTTREVLEASV